MDYMMEAIINFEILRWNFLWFNYYRLIKPFEMGEDIII